MSATRTSASIRIGGPIRHDLADQLVDVISESEVGLDWSGEAFVPGASAELAAAVGTDGVLCLVDAERIAGVFTDLEEFLSEHGIPFDRASEAIGDLDGEYVRYRPETGCTSGLADQTGEPVVLAAEVECVRVLLHGALEQQSPELVRQALAALDRVLGPALTALGPFVIVTEGSL